MMNAGIISMKKIYVTVLILMVAALSADLSSQVIIRRQGGFVLIDTDKDIGRPGDEIRVFRVDEKTITTGGRVKLVKCANCLAAARVVSEREGLRVRANDFLNVYRTTEWLRKNLGVSPGREARVVLRRKGYAVLNEGISLGEPGNRLIVVREQDSIPVEIGVVRIIKTRGDKTAVAIEEEYGPMRIKKGDYVLAEERTSPDDEMDVDYYLYGPFR